MSAAWALVVVPGTCALLAGLLFMSAYAEQRFLSPRSLIRRAVRARNSPEFAEAFVARQFERLLREESAR
jgi:hypothetical protein